MVELHNVYFEEVNEVRKIKGEIIDRNEKFITVKTLKRQFEISMLKVIKIEKILEEFGEKQTDRRDYEKSI